MNGHSKNLNANEATAHLKNILNVGKPESTDKTDEKVTDSSKMDVEEGAEVPSFQQIELNGSEESVALYGKNVSISSSPLLRGVNSSNIIIENMVDYGWEYRPNHGHLVSIHLSKNYLACALKATISESGFVRVIKHNTNNHLLLRGFKGGVTDLAFAHSVSKVLLACVDEVGELYVYEIFDDGKELSNQLYVHIGRPRVNLSRNYHRITWCPYVPEDGSSDEKNDSAQVGITSMMSSLLALTHDEKAEIWNLETVIKEYGKGDIQLENVKVGLQLITEHKSPITATAFSPDAIALATASLDGEVKFFQVNAQGSEEPSKCLHEWIPHHGKPLSSLFFLDNHKNYNPDIQFWKFAITGANDNQEIKLWSCKTWCCLQTINMLPSPADDVKPCLRAGIDLSAGYLILSDINRKVMYILKIHQDGEASISCISEYVLKFPVLSFAILDVVPHKGKPLTAKTSAADDDAFDDEEDEKDDGFDDTDSERKFSHFLFKLFWIHPKSFQYCRILYDPKIASPAGSVESLSSSQDSFEITVYMDAAVQHLQGEVMQRMSDTDAALKECVAKNLKSKSFGDNMSSCMIPLMQESIQASCKDLFLNHVIPSLDKCCQLLFTQMNEVFAKGSSEYLSKLEKHLNASNGRLDKTAHKYQEQVDKFTGDAQGILDKLVTQSQENDDATAKDRENLLIAVRQTVRDEVNKAMSENSQAAAMAALRSQQSTPAPQTDPQIILRLASQKQYNEAFQHALSAVDVKLVLMLCEKVSVEQVFDISPCPLAQNVLLSLIQQLSGDLHEKTEVKLRYIEEGIASLDANDLLTKEHLGHVLGAIQMRINLFLKANPQHKFKRNCRKILWSIDSFLK